MIKSLEDSVKREQQRNEKEKQLRKFELGE